MWQIGFNNCPNYVYSLVRMFVPSDDPLGYFQRITIGDLSCINCSIMDVTVTGSFRFDSFLMIANSQGTDSISTNMFINQAILGPNMMKSTGSVPLQPLKWHSGAHFSSQQIQYHKWSSLLLYHVTQTKQFTFYFCEYRLKKLKVSWFCIGMDN